MFRTLLMPLVLSLLVSACAESPTAPAPSPGPVVTTAPPTTPEPTAPEPPAAPVPAPAPEPPAVRGFTFAAETGSAHWYGRAILLGHFELTITPTRVEVPGYGFDILLDTPNHAMVIAGTRNVETLTIENVGGTWRWTYSGLAGQANGGMVRR